MVRLPFFAFFTHALTNRLLLTGPTTIRDWQRHQKPRQRRPLPLPPLSRFVAFAGASTALSHAAGCLPKEVKRAANGRMTDSGFKKKL
jgi:hypothetical protein